MKSQIHWRIKPGLRISRVLVRQLVRNIWRAGSRFGLWADKRHTLALHIVDDHEIAQLNARCLGKRGPTDVLSFPTTSWELRTTMASFVGPPICMGDVVLSWQAVMRQARSIGEEGQLHEATVLCIHGLVHLLGHDHGKHREARVMHRCELRALASVRMPDIPRPYGLHPVRQINALLKV